MNMKVGIITLPLFTPPAPTYAQRGRGGERGRTVSSPAMCDGIEGLTLPTLRRTPHLLRDQQLLFSTQLSVAPSCGGHWSTLYSSKLHCARFLLHALHFLPCLCYELLRLFCRTLDDDTFQI